MKASSAPSDADKGTARRPGMQDNGQRRDLRACAELRPFLLRALPRRPGRFPALPYPPGRYREHSRGAQKRQGDRANRLQKTLEKGKLNVVKCYLCLDQKV